MVDILPFQIRPKTNSPIPTISNAYVGVNTPASVISPASVAVGVGLSVIISVGVGASVIVSVGVAEGVEVKAGSPPAPAARMTKPRLKLTGVLFSLKPKVILCVPTDSLISGDHDQLPEPETVAVVD